MNALLQDLGANLRAGMKVALFRRIGHNDLRASPEQFVALAGLTLLLLFLGGVAVAGLDGYFNPHALTTDLAYLASLLFSALVIAHIVAEPRLLLALPVAVLAAEPLFIAAHVLVRQHAIADAGFAENAWRHFYYGLMAWSLAAVFVALVHLAGRKLARAAAG